MNMTTPERRPGQNSGRPGVIVGVGHMSVSGDVWRLKPPPLMESFFLERCSGLDQEG